MAGGNLPPPPPNFGSPAEFAWLLGSLGLWLLSVLLLFESSVLRATVRGESPRSSSEGARQSARIYWLLRLDIVLPLGASLALLWLWFHYWSLREPDPWSLPYGFFLLPDRYSPGFLIASFVPGLLALVRFGASALLLRSRRTALEISGYAGVFASILQIVAGLLALTQVLR